MFLRANVLGVRGVRGVRAVRAVRWALESPHARVYRVWARPYAVCAGVGVATYGVLKGAWVVLGGEAPVDAALAAELARELGPGAEQGPVR